MALNFPGSPTNGQTYNGYVYSSAVGAWQAKPAAQSPFYTSDTPPANPVAGDSWFNTNDGTMYVYFYDGNTYQWVEHRSQIAKNQVGLVPLVPTSIAVANGSASVSVSGLVTFTNTSELNLNGVFTSAYQNYKIVINNDSFTNATNINLRMRASGTTLAGTYYQGGVIGRSNGTTGSFQNRDNGTAWVISTAGSAHTDGRIATNVDVYNPYNAKVTGMTFSTHGQDGTSVFYASGSGGQYTGNSQDGITLFSDSGTWYMTGTLKVYGYN